ncbi:hypothetical protein BKA64DRAFT_300674 [Cadophora sp. MPI-SDFR-AT-0126]|nr:hypothetical protein BKA64DRAFT_300674 [Leotiomycetes sp. MPI-SDFR-AT-0126]
MSSYTYLQQHPPMPRTHDRDNVSLLSQSRASSPTVLARHGISFSKSHFEPSTTENLKESQMSGWPDQPQTLRKSTSEICLNVAIEIFLVLISLPLLALAIAVTYYKDRKVVDSEWNLFKQIINSIGTAFPYIFGLIVGRSIKLFASYRLSHGVTLLHLEQITNSSTFGSTLNTHILLHPFNYITISLFTLWIFSPIGSRVSLGLIEPKFTPVISNTTVRYLDTTQATKFYSEQPEDLVEIIAGPINALYASSLMGPETAKMSSMDQWGNIKIPYLDRLSRNLTANSTGWVSLSDLDLGEINYSSLLGIPVSKPLSPGQGKSADVANKTWTMSTTYLSLSCDTMARGSLVPLNTPISNNENKNITWHSRSTNPSQLFSFAVDGFISPNTSLESSHSISSFLSATNASSIPHTLLFQSPIWTDDLSLNATANLTFASAYCRLSQQYVDVEVHCTGSGAGTGTGNQNCGVTAMREALTPHAPSEFTVLGFSFAFSMLSYLLPLSTGESVTGGVLPQSTATELFLSGTEATLSHLTKADLSLLTQSEMEIRLGQVLNTYYTASLAPYGVTGNLTAGNSLEIESPGELTVWENRYSVNKKWLALYFISCAVLLAAVVCGIVLKAVVVAPDILGWVSSLTRDNPHVGAPGGGTAMSGWKRTKLLGGMRVRIGDVGDKGGVGYIAVAAEEDARELEKERLYS